MKHCCAEFNDPFAASIIDGKILYLRWCGRKHRRLHDLLHNVPVGITESVDGLLRVTHDKETAAFESVSSSSGFNASH